MTVTINSSLQNQQVDACGDDLDLGFIDIYTGTQPAFDEAPTGTLLVSLALAADAYNAAASGSADATNSPSGVAVASGTAGYAQQRNAANTRWFYASVSAVGDGGDVQLDDIAITMGGTTTLDTSTLNQPNSQ